MKSVYYIGLNAANTIGNNSFFKGSITAYPTGEAGNIPFFKTREGQPMDAEFMKEFKHFSHQIASLLSRSFGAEFMFFNKKIGRMCKDMNDVNFVCANDFDLVDNLNDKFFIREYLFDKVPTLRYVFGTGEEIKASISPKKPIVIQGKSGAGGDTTFFVKTLEDLQNCQLQDEQTYAISKYIKNTPINTTFIVTDKSPIILPTSVQLIRNDGNFRYVGGDFAYARRFSPQIKADVEKYTTTIAEELKDMGYRGICGVDYVVSEDGKVSFMELNPRFQGSSFLISRALKQQYGTSIAELNYNAFTGTPSPNVEGLVIDSSFVISRLPDDCQIFGEPDAIEGAIDPSLGINDNQRNIYNRSLLKEDCFEQCINDHNLVEQCDDAPTPNE